jgi:peptide/nickel transport system substrate-binding protein
MAWSKYRPARFVSPFVNQPFVHNVRRRKMRKLLVFLSLLVTASMLLAACGPTPPAAPEEPAAPAEPSGGEPTGAGGAADTATFTDAVIGEPETLDPALNYETAGAEIIQNVYETLVFYDGDKTDAFVPKLAESWELSADGTVYTFNIRQGVTFHEGGELTPSDVAYSFQRGLLQGGYASPQWLLAEPFFGVGNDDISIIVDGGASADDREAMSANDPAALVAACEQVKGAIVADDAAGTVTMTLASPWGPFLPTIAQGWGSVVDMEWIIENGGWDGSCDTWQNFYPMSSEEDPFTAIMNGTGPFVFDHWTPGEELVLVRNDNYWTEPAKLERVVQLFIPEWGTRFSMLQAGDADTVDVPVENRAQPDEMVGERCEYDAAANAYAACEVTDDSQALRLYIGRPGLIQDVILFNFDIVTEGNSYVGSGALDGNGVPSDFFADPNIRHAFSYAFDWDTFIGDVYNGEAVQSLTLPLPGMPGYDLNAPHFTFDLAKSEESFKAADLDHDGVPAGEDPEGDVWTTGFRVQMGYNQGNTTRQITAEILAANLAQVNELFSIEILGLPWPSYLQSQRAGTLPIMTGGWLEDIHDPHNWYQPYTVGAYGARQRLPQEVKDQFSALLDAGVAETDPEARHEIYLELNQLYFDVNSGTPIVLATSHGFEQRWVKGRVLNPIFPGTYYYPMWKE